MHARRSVGCRVLSVLVPVCVGGSVSAFEITLQNDSATDGSGATPCMCFIPDDEAAAWLASPCNGDIVAVQVFWKSEFGGASDLTEHSIILYAAGAFPDPGSVLQNAGAVPAVIQQPTLSDGAFNEFRFLDTFQPNPTTPLSVPINRNETFVVSLRYLNSSSKFGATTAWDSDGCQAGRNAFQTGGSWGDLCTQRDGDWIIRAVVDCFGDGIPTTSEWGLVVLALSVAAAGTICIHKAS